MIVIKMSLLSAVTGKHSDLGSMIIVNQGTGTNARGNYRGKTIRKNAKLDSAAVRQGEVNGHARNAEPVWTLLRKMLEDMGY